MRGTERWPWIRERRTALVILAAALGWNGCGKTSAGGGSISECWLDNVCGSPCRGENCGTSDDAGALGDATAPAPNDAAHDSNLDATAMPSSTSDAPTDAGASACMTTDGSPIACDFSGCANPPDWTCSPAEACDQLDCGGISYDENGCTRTQCDSDADCAANERCAVVPLDSTACTAADAGCSCVTFMIHIVGTACEPEAIAGPRGDFEQLEVVSNGYCIDQPCVTSWLISPDGQVQFSKNGVTGTATLSAEDQELLLNDAPTSSLQIPLINGTQLRTALRDGTQCDPAPLDVSVTVRLQLSTGTLRRDVTGCVLSGPDGNVFDLLYQLVNRY